MADLAATLRRHERVGLDTSVFIYHIEGTARLAEPAGVALDGLAGGPFAGVTSVLTLMEIAVKPLQVARPDVAEEYEIHPQTLRLYEREGLLKPSRSDGNTRLYTPEDLERLEVILHLTRDLGVNLAGVEIILNMREKMGEMQTQIQEFIASLNHELAARSARPPGPEARNSLIPLIHTRRK